MALHILRGSGPPNGITPPGIGVHYVDTLNKDTYLSIATDTPSDWILQGGAATSFTTFLALLDTNSSYNAQAGKIPIVNTAEDALEFDNESLINLKDVDDSGLQDNMILFYDFDDNQTFKPQYRIYWRDNWAPGVYKTQEMVNDQGWTMIANKLTTDRAAPQPDGASSFALPDLPTWTPGSTSPIAIQGVRFTVGDEVVTVDGFRFWRATDTGDESYAFIIEDITDPSNKTLISAGTLPQGPIGWVEIGVAGTFFFEGQIIDIRFATEVATGSSAWSHDWTLQDEGAGLPNQQTYTRSADHTNLRINIIDDTVTDVKSDLDQLKVGDLITFFESDNFGRFNDYQVAGTPSYSNGDTILELPVVRINNGQAVRVGNLGQGDATIKSGILPADYVSLPNFWFLNPPAIAVAVKGYLITAWNETPTLTDDAFGVDVRGHAWTSSDDWDVVTTTLGGGGSTSGGGGGSDTFLGLTDVPNTYVGQAGKLAVVRNDELALEFIEAEAPVESVFGRTGIVVSQTGDYSSAQVGADTSAQVDAKDVASIATHVAEPDPHTQYLLPSDLPGLAIGYFTGITSLIDGAYLLKSPDTLGNVENSVSADGVDVGVPVLVAQYLNDPVFPVDGTLLETGSTFTLDYEADTDVDIRIEIGLRSVGGIFTTASTQDFTLSEGRSVTSLTVTIPEVNFLAGETAFSRLFVIKTGGGGPKTLTIFQEGTYISRTLTNIPGQAFPAPHAESHEVGGSDQVDHNNLLNAQGFASHATLDAEQTVQDGRITVNENDILPLQQNSPPSFEKVSGRFLQAFADGAGTFNITDTGSYNTNGTFRFTQQSSSGSGQGYFGEATIAGLVLVSVDIVRSTGNGYAVSDTITLDIPDGSENVPAVIQLTALVAGQRWENLPTEVVTSVFGRIGDVVAESSDYNADEIDDSSSVKKFATQPQLDQISTNTIDIGDNTTSIGDNADDIVINADQIESNKNKLIFGAGIIKAQSTSTGIIVAGSLDFDTTSVNIGNNAGSTGTGTVAIGPGAGQTTQGNNSVAIGNTAGQTNQGAGSIAIGRGAGLGNQGAKSIIISSKNTSATNNTNDNSIHFESGSNSSMIYNGGGVNDPMTFSMPVDTPKVLADDFTLTDGNQADGRILVSDASGVAAWRDQAENIVDEVTMAGDMELTGVFSLWKNGELYTSFNTTATSAFTHTNMDSITGIIPVADRPSQSIPFLFRIDNNGLYRITYRTNGGLRFNIFDGNLDNIEFSTTVGNCTAIYTAN